jgi:replication-associated recombination protein RarA
LEDEEMEDESVGSFFNNFTRSGLKVGDVSSAIQKTIRRGDERLALRFALEFIPRYERYFWRRLAGIAQEDIGISAMDVIMFVTHQENQYFLWREDNRKGGTNRDGKCRLILANTIMAMCRAPKTRLADTMQCAVSQAMLHGWVPEIPDYVFDKHTQKGRQMGRGVDHWREEGCILIPDAELPDPYADEAYDWWAGKPDRFIKTDWQGELSGETAITPAVVKAAPKPSQQMPFNWGDD